jgi:hypothetical protein
MGQTVGVYVHVGTVNLRRLKFNTFTAARSETSWLDITKCGLGKRLTNNVVKRVQNVRNALQHAVLLVAQCDV